MDGLAGLANLLISGGAAQASAQPTAKQALLVRRVRGCVLGAGSGRGPVEVQVVDVDQSRTHDAANENAEHERVNHVGIEPHLAGPSHCEPQTCQRPSAPTVAVPVRSSRPMLVIPLD